MPGMFGNLGSASQGLWGGLQNNAGSLLYGGMGMLAGNNMQEGFQNAMYGARAGSEADERRRAQIERAKQLHALDAATKAGDLGQLSPTMQGLVSSSPEMGMNIAADRLKPQTTEYASAGDGIIFDRATGKAKNIGGEGAGGTFKGNSLEAQALNRMIAGGMDPDKAAQWAGGKMYQDPSTGAMRFMTPQDWLATQGGQGGGQQAPSGQQQQMPASQGVGPAQAGGVGTALTAGKPNQAITEDAAKGMSLEQVAGADAVIADKLFGPMSNKKDLAKQYAGDLGKYYQSPDFQVGMDAITNVVQSYLYAASGQSAPAAEVEKNVNLVTPSLIDSPERIEAKRQRLKRMMHAIEIKARKGQVAPQSEEGWQDLGGGVRIREMQ